MRMCPTDVEGDGMNSRMAIVMTVVTFAAGAAGGLAVVGFQELRHWLAMRHLRQRLEKKFKEPGGATHRLFVMPTPNERADDDGHRPPPDRSWLDMESIRETR